MFIWGLFLLLVTTERASCAGEKGEISILKSQTLSCFFPENCKNDSCVSNSQPIACETCAKGFYRLGSVCQECGAIPWATLVLVFAIGCIAFTGIRGGYPLPVAIKVKMLVDFLQILLLSLSLRTAWRQGGATLWLLDKTTFAFLNAQMANLECYISSLSTYYVDWLSSAVPFLFVITIILMADCTLGRTHRRFPHNYKLLRRRSTFRRFLVHFILIVYAPLTSLAVRSYACEENVNITNFWISGLYNDSNEVENRWAYDQSISCNEAPFQAVTFSSALFLILLSLLFPIVLLFFTIRLFKLKRLSQKRALYGAVYECYRPTWCFTEGIILFRKLILIGLTDLYPITPLVQLSISLVLSFAYFLMVLLGRPYRKGYWKVKKARMDVHNSFEVLSSAAVLVIHSSTFLLFYGIIEEAIDWMTFLTIAFTLIIWGVIHMGQVVFEEIPVERIEQRREEPRPPDVADAERSDDRWAFLKTKKDGVTASELQHRELVMAEF